jgi:hypothetical protein
VAPPTNRKLSLGFHCCHPRITSSSLGQRLNLIGGLLKTFANRAIPRTGYEVTAVVVQL